MNPKLFTSTESGAWSWTINILWIKKHIQSCIYFKTINELLLCNNHNIEHDCFVTKFARSSTRRTVLFCILSVPNPQTSRYQISTGRTSHATRSGQPSPGTLEVRSVHSAIDLILSFLELVGDSPVNKNSESYGPCRPGLDLAIGSCSQSVFNHNWAFSERYAVPIGTQGTVL